MSYCNEDCTNRQLKIKHKVSVILKINGYEPDHSQPLSCTNKNGRNNVRPPYLLYRAAHTSTKSFVPDYKLVFSPVLTDLRTQTSARAKSIQQAPAGRSSLVWRVSNEGVDTVPLGIKLKRLHVFNMKTAVENIDNHLILVIEGHEKITPTMLPQTDDVKTIIRITVRQICAAYWLQVYNHVDSAILRSMTKTFFWRENIVDGAKLSATMFQLYLNMTASSLEANAITTCLRYLILSYFMKWFLWFHDHGHTLMECLYVASCVTSPDVDDIAISMK